MNHLQPDQQNNKSAMGRITNDVLLPYCLSTISFGAFAASAPSPESAGLQGVPGFNAPMFIHNSFPCFGRSEIERGGEKRDEDVIDRMTWNLLSTRRYQLGIS
jgi:hypothetical protein